MITYQESGQAYATKPITERIGAAYGLDHDFQEQVRAVAFTALRRVAAWNWGAAALQAGTLHIDEMLIDLVGMAFTYAYETGDRDPVAVVQAVTKAWGKEQYAQAQVVSQRDHSGERVAVVVGPRNAETPSGLRTDDERLTWRSEPNDEAARQWAELAPLLTARQQEVLPIYAEVQSYAEAGRILGVHPSSVESTVRRARARISKATGLPYTSTEGAE